ncbi:(E)-4-hydroxy-3-methylbut-2-enyl-diphosphate synthase [Flavitalea sp. BT771]|uniref:(E)-4-hydroxy-3-methylbut-2-enyl-diphosphate synthase n=1 Tax=Flavitalea sp. BT771 TaxID=3063329 RepID=UPI0026E1D9C8|nr:(E)-4-hydroxy-3-methylbut-2-enyl-diphosphate synthase [Flavitalea sp. BT771]MDO6434204.1 (E)-4-hydroxy-3-methylbut-2-enyl-diphosphate synthase [Flavitalea sp. BT771]MDV6223104.1 (E)-4-hydroxy-3-methylbut-2-enyl-diphosphate synthase [Flavitalea sp. BT771]
MQQYCHSLTEYRRLKTLEVKIGDLLLGNFHPIRIQTMTTTDTMDTIATVEQSIRCIEAGAELVRITAPSKKEAENLLNIKNELRRRGYNTPLVADIHFTPNAAEIAARIVEKVRVNPGNYIDKKKFEFIEYTDTEYNEEIDRIRERFTPLVKICKEYGTAMRIGTNHGSLSDRIMSRYGDTPMGMVESAMEFLRVARDERYHNIILSMKSSNPLVMVQAYRLLIRTMEDEFGACYPLHLGVTEAGDGEDGRIKSAIGIGTLLEDGIGDTIRVSLTEDPEFEIPVCKDLVKRYENESRSAKTAPAIPPVDQLPYSPFEYRRRATKAVANIGDHHVPVVVADFMQAANVDRMDLKAVGYSYDAVSDKWNIGDAAADYLYTGKKLVGFDLPGTLRVICDHAAWMQTDRIHYLPLYQGKEYLETTERSSLMNFISIDAADSDLSGMLEAIRSDETAVLCCWSSHPQPMLSVRRLMIELMSKGIDCPLILAVESSDSTIDEQLIHFSTEAGSLFLEGMGDGIWLMNDPKKIVNNRVSGRTYLETRNNHQFINNTSFSILQATRTRISKTEYISCPSCGRTLFDLQETTARIRSVTHHLKGVKIAIMGCIVNGPGEMADADFGYVGSGPGKITLYRGKEVVKRGVDSAIAVQELINLLKESDAWIEPEPVVSEGRAIS